MRRGITLPELCLTLLIVGVVVTIALPRIQRVNDSLAVDRAAQEIAAAHRRARMAAVLQSRPLELTIDPGNLTLRSSGTIAPIWRANGPSADRVLLAGPPRTLTFSPVGITVGVSNASFVLTRGAARRTVVVSRLGRVRIAP